MAGDAVAGRNGNLTATTSGLSGRGESWLKTCRTPLNSASKIEIDLDEVGSRSLPGSAACKLGRDWDRTQGLRNSKLSSESLLEICCNSLEKESALETDGG